VELTVVRVLISPPGRAVIVQSDDDVAALEDLCDCAVRFLDAQTDGVTGGALDFDRLRVMRMRQLAERIKLL
jgi:hypothetical protein